MGVWEWIVLVLVLVLGLVEHEHENEQDAARGFDGVGPVLLPSAPSEGEMKETVSADALARVYGSPGAKPRLMGFFRAAWPLFLALMVAGYLFRAAWPVPALSKTHSGFLLLLLCGVIAWSLVWSERRLAQFLKGARGEEEVARVLALLPAAYRVFHGVSVGRGLLARSADYDHIIVGPTGVFLVETKNWAGRISVEGGRILCDGVAPDRPPLEQLKQAAAGLRRRLAGEARVEVAVRPVLCFAGPSLTGGPTGAAGVVVCPAAEIAAVIRDASEPPVDAVVQERVARYLEGLLQAV